jgi:hypothetical protein
LDIGLPVTNKSTKTNERNAVACHPILLQRRAGAASDPFDISVGEQGIDHCNTSLHFAEAPRRKR